MGTVSSRSTSTSTARDEAPRDRTADAPIRVPPVEIRPSEGLVLVAERAIALSVREFGLLVVLASDAGHVLGRDALYQAVWGRDMRRGDRSIDVYVHKLRTRLESAAPGWGFIHTHIGFGYRFSPEPASAGAAKPA